MGEVLTLKKLKLEFNGASEFHYIEISSVDFDSHNNVGGLFYLVYGPVCLKRGGKEWTGGPRTVVIPVAPASFCCFNTYE